MKLVPKKTLNWYTIQTLFGQYTLMLVRSNFHVNRRLGNSAERCQKLTNLWCSLRLPPHIFSDRHDRKVTYIMHTTRPHSYPNQSKNVRNNAIEPNKKRLRNEAYSSKFCYEVTVCIGPDTMRYYYGWWVKTMKKLSFEK